MSANPSPFQVAQQSSNNLGRAFDRVKDENAIERILSDSIKTGDPEVLQQSIGKILSQVSPERQGVAMQYLQNAYANAQKKAETTKLENRETEAAKAGGYTPYAPPAVQAQQVKDKAKEGRLNAYGLGAGTTANPNALMGGLAAGGEQQPPQTPPTGQVGQSIFKQMSQDQLIQATGHPDREISDPAKAELKRRSDEEKANRSQFEPEADKLEAKRVSELADEVEKEYHSAKEEDMRLDRMEKIDKEGNVSTPALVKALDAFGIPIGILSNPATEEYRKLETDFVRNVSKVFPGGKITNYEIQSYLKTIPSLMNSPEGRKAIIRNRKLLNEAKRVRYDAYKKILKDNNGRKPQNLGILIEEATADKLSQIEDQFISGVQEQIEKFQTPIRMTDPKGNKVDIPPNQIEAALKAGAKFG